MKRARLLPGLTAIALDLLFVWRVHGQREWRTAPTLKITVTQCDLGEVSISSSTGSWGPYPTLPQLPVRSRCRSVPLPPFDLPARQPGSRREQPGPTPGDTPVDLGPGEVTRISAIDPPWACISRRLAHVSPAFARTPLRSFARATLRYRSGRCAFSARRRRKDVAHLPHRRHARPCRRSRLPPHGACRGRAAARDLGRGHHRVRARQRAAGPAVPGRRSRRSP